MRKARDIHVILYKIAKKSRLLRINKKAFLANFIASLSDIHVHHINIITY